ncbi:MAG: hypothetical protein AB1898_32545 [Acidobacteriota bacterium]
MDRTNDLLTLSLAFFACIPAAFANTLAFSEDYRAQVDAALRSGPDVWGEEILARPEGPTYENVVGKLRPLMWCGKEFTTSGVYYLVFGRPAGLEGGGDAALHVADGSEVISRHHKKGNRLTIFVGSDGKERYGQSLQRLSAPRLFQGYQPLLLTEYSDEHGNRYRQQSFADWLPNSERLASYIQLEVEAPEGRSTQVVLRIALSESGLTGAGNRLSSNDGCHLAASQGAQVGDQGISYHLVLSPGETRKVFLIRPLDPVPMALGEPSEQVFVTARNRLCAYWDQKLAGGVLFQVPEEQVMHAQRNILIQNLFLGWQYSYGNAYQDFFQPEGNDTATLLGQFGFAAEQRAIHQTLLGMTKGREQYRNWENGEKLSHGAHYYLLTRDRSFIEANKRSYDFYLEEMSKEIAEDPNGLLKKEPYSGDISAAGYYLHQQAVCWRGMRDMAMLYRELGYRSEGDRYWKLAQRFKRAMDTAVGKSQSELSDGTLFVPTELLSDVLPYDPVTATKLGTYWNLVFPYALASGLFPQPTSWRILDYMFRHGSFLLGLVRCNYYPVEIGSHKENGLPGYSTSGADNVYAVNVVESLSQHDQPDRMVLTLYGKMAHGMTRETFVSGEGDSYGVVPGEYYRAMYLPPNSANNALLLKLLRSMMLFETVDQSGRPLGLRLTHSTPRAWLADGQEIGFVKAPSLFGPVSLQMTSALSRGQIAAELEMPSRNRPSQVTLRLRTPGRRPIQSVVINGKKHLRFDPEKETVDLTGMTGHLKLVVRY